MSQERISSVERFKRLTQELQRDVIASSKDELDDAGDVLVAQMQAVAPLGPTGNLRRSIRKGPGKKPTQIRVMAGGSLTTTRSGKGHPYDYSRAVEFGTEDTRPHPFFFPSYRLRIKKIRSKVKRRLTADVKKRSA